MVIMTGGLEDYRNLDSNFMTFRIGKRENSILHCLFSLGVNPKEYSTVSIKRELSQMTGLQENECSRLLSTLHQKKIINKRYLHHKHELSVILLPRAGWQENIENTDKKQDITVETKKENGSGNKLLLEDNIEFIELIVQAVEKYSRGKNPKLLVAEVDEILHKFKKK